MITILIIITIIQNGLQFANPLISGFSLQGLHYTRRELFRLAQIDALRVYVNAPQMVTVGPASPALWPPGRPGRQSDHP